MVGVRRTGHPVLIRTNGRVYRGFRRLGRAACQNKRDQTE